MKIDNAWETNVFTLNAWAIQRILKFNDSIKIESNLILDI